jgi:hypothetical protein
MKLRQLGWKVVAAVAFLMGFPLVAKADDDVGGIVGSALGLAGAIIDVAGDS